MELTPINGAAARRLMAHGALLVDIREPCERAAAALDDAIEAPLSELPRHVGGSRLPAVIFACASGEAARREAPRLARVSRAPLSFYLEGGAATIHETPAPARSRLPLDQQYHVLLGGLILLGLLLGLLAWPGFLALVALPGLSLVWSGATGHCDITALLARMRWNREDARS